MELPMFDRHIIPNAEWGIHPLLFTLFGIEIQAYPVFLILAVVVGGLVYWWEAKKQQSDTEHTFYIALAAILGGIIGAKIPSWIVNFKTSIESLPNYSFFLSGRTIVGGLIGGTISVLVVKKYFGISGKRGNLFAPAIALGMAIGRIGCFLRGCCYGVATTSGIGVDFGDSLHRHPTQLYEVIFWLGLFVVLQKIKNNVTKPGALFQVLLTSYFIFRFFLEFIKDDPDQIWGFTIYQVLIICFLLFFYRHELYKMITLPFVRVVR